MRFGDLPREDEPEPGSRYAALTADIAAEELREDAALMVCGDAEPRVADADDRLVVGPLGLDFHRSPFRRVLDGVREEVSDHLREPVAIAANEERLVDRVELKLMRLALRRVEHYLRLEQCDQIDDVVPQFERLLLDPLQVEQSLRREPSRLASVRMTSR